MEERRGEGDFVLCKVKGAEYLHLVKAIKTDRFLIGNNRGAGVTKARRVAEAMKDKTIIIANSHPPEGLYRDLGFQHFASREMAGNLLARLIAETRLVPSMVDIDDERCCSCGDELHNGECINYFCPMRDRY